MAAVLANTQRHGSRKGSNDSHLLREEVVVQDVEESEFGADRCIPADDHTEALEIVHVGKHIGVFVGPHEAEILR